ncbi:MAG: DNA polymerase IV [Deltaproteobacteria bacterium]|nr:DNA polymerase IV [Deltaproteobacteria bacterium]
MARTILHADMDAFFASVEQRDDPKLLGLPVVVGGPAPRGVVAAASYEARRYGIHSAMPMVRAMERCPKLIRIAPRMSRYTEVSHRVFAIFRSYSSLVEGLSLDEAFVDVTGSLRLHGDAVTIARRIKRRVRDELDLVVSIGVGPNKLIAKIASDLDKPDGLRVVLKDEVEAFLHPLPVRRLFGVGAVTARKLEALDVTTVSDLATHSRDDLIALLGASSGAHLHDLARGIDERPVITETPPKSLGAEDTFTSDLNDDDDLKEIVRRQAEHVGEGLRAKKLVAKVVVLKVKSHDHRVKTRQKSLRRPTSDGAALARVACALLPAARRSLGGDDVPLRLTGVTAAMLTATSIADAAPLQLTFDEDARAQGDALSQTLDAISARFGKGALHRGPVDDAAGRLRDERDEHPAEHPLPTSARDHDESEIYVELIEEPD